MDIKQCPSCQKQFDQDRRLSKQLPCGCVSCLQCYGTVFQLIRKIECAIHQKVYDINPEELQDYVVQDQIQLQELPQPQEEFIDQEQINEQSRLLQDQYVQTQNYQCEIIKEIQESSKIFQHIQSLSIQEILKVLIDQFATSNSKRENLIKRLSELQIVNVAQQQQALILGQQVPNLRQNPQGQLQYKFQQILSEIEKLKKEQQMDVQSLRINFQRSMFNMFIYLSENSDGQLLTEKKAEFLIQKHFKQFKVVRSFSKLPNYVVPQQVQFQSQNNQQQFIQESSNIDQQQYQNQVIGMQQGQDLALIKQLSISQENSLQEKQIIDTRLSFSQLEQKFLNLKNDFSFVNQIELLCQEQAMSIVPGPHVDITFGNFLQFLTQIKVENVSIQSLNNSPLNNSGLTEYTYILQQLSTISDQQICLKLIQVLNISKNQLQLQQSASNALTILNYMNFTFNNQDFSNLDLTKADLSDTTFTNCNFSNSNLTQANLRNTKFINCDLSNSNFTSIITEYPHIFTGHTSQVTAVAISSDSEFIVSGSDDDTVRLWDVKTDTSKTMSSHTSSVWSVAISSNSEFIVFGSGDKTVRLWNVKTGTCKTMRGHTSYVTAVAISRDSEFIVSGSFDKTVRLWDVKIGTCKTMSGHIDRVISISISSDSEFIVSGSGDKTVRLWNVKTGTCKTMRGHADSVSSVSISNDSQYIVSGSYDETIRLWSTKSLECIKVFSGHSSYILSVIFSVNNNYIISGSRDKTIRVWSIQSGDQICVLNGHTDSVGSISLSRDGNWLVSSNGSQF